MAFIGPDRAAPVTHPLAALDAGNYQAHDLHRGDRVWLETNCYADVWIELLHALRLNPVASMAFTVGMDFEGDQWTFFKPPHHDLHRFYGIDVQELALWRPLELHLAEQLRRGRVPLVEVDAFFLPDTVGVSHGIEHVKTTIAATTIDPLARRLGYFHNAGYFELSADDYDGLFAVARAGLSPYAEIVKLDSVTYMDDGTIRKLATCALREHVARMPTANPFTEYRSRYESDAAWLRDQDMPVFYAYAFATLRQCGACAELASAFLHWLANEDDEQHAAASSFAKIASAAKAMQFKIARMMATGKAGDVSDLLDQMETSWNCAAADLRERHAA